VPAPSGPPLPAEAPDPALIRDPNVPLAAEVVATNPADGLQGMMVPTGGGA
jgi:phospholipid/cholesterol/gamma-HCH transport system substrate-binding protein